jgi:hypothetical protein
VDDPEVLLRRRRIWGVPADAVAAWVTSRQREQTELRAQVAALEARVSHLTAERDIAEAASAALKETLAHLEAEKAEWHGRPETIRAEAIQFVVDAYAEAQQAREQSAREIAAERSAAQATIAAQYATAEEEITEMRRVLVVERQQHEAAVASLEKQRQEALAALSALGRGLLAELERVDTRGSAPQAPAADTVSTQIPEEPHPAPEPVMQGETPTVTGPIASAEAPRDSAVSAQRGAPPEDAMLARALDELEAILRGNRKVSED